MSGKVAVVFALLVAQLVSCAASSPGEAKDSANKLQQLLAKRGTERDTAGRQDSARMERRTHISGDEREMMAKQIMQAISDMMPSDCLSDRDYQGWVDFGRRDAE